VAWLTQMISIDKLTTADRGEWEILFGAYNEWR
jgi:hypothetical protein